MTNRNMKLARAPRDYKREYAQYHSKPRMVAERAQRNQARRIVGLAKGDPREVDHKNPISNGGSNVRSNLRAVSLVENRKKFTKTAEERKRNPYLLPAASFGGAALAAALATKRYKGITKHLANRFENIGGDRRAAEMASEIPKGVRDNARAIINSLIDSGVDPSKARIGIAATGGTGKTTLGRALSEELGILHTKLDINNSASFGGHDAYLTKNPVTPGTVVDQTHLFTQANPEKHFDVMIHLKRPTKDIKEGLLKRKRGAHQVDLYDYDKLSKDIETGFNAAGGKTIYSNPGDAAFRTTTTVKIKDGNNWGGNIDNKLLSLGISPGKLNKMSYEDKVLTLSEGRRTKGTGPLRYVNYTAPANIGLATVAGGAAPFAVSSLYDNREKFTKTAAQLYHGSPFGGLTSLSPREPRGHTDYERQRAVFMTDNPDAAALYALARDKERKNRGWAAIGGRLQLGPSAGLNEKGYLYSVNTDDYLSPPKGQENSGFAIPREVGVSGVKEVTPAEYEHLIDRFDTKGAFKDHIRSLISKERPKDQEKIKMLQAHLKTASTKHHLITGVPGAGKSTIAKRIAKEKNLPLFEIDSDPRFKHALQLIDEGKMDESNALQKQMFHDAIARKDPHVIEGAQVMLDPTLARQHELQILDGSVDELAPRWANREAIKHIERAVSAGKLPTKDETYYDSLYRNTVYPRYQEQLAGLRKTASSQHYLVTGHSGAGKSTLARKLSEETGAPIISLDDVPSIRALLEEQKATAKESGGKLDLSPETTAKKKAVELKAIQDAIAAKNPAIIEGSYLLDHDPSMFKGHKMMLVDRARDSILDQRVERQRLRDLSNGKEWSDARAAGVRARGSQLLDYYQPGVDTWRNSSLVEKRAAAVATKTDPAKWEAAKQEAKSKMGGKHSARAMQLATKIYKDNGGGYSGAKPTSSTNSLKKWTKQDWGYSGKDKPGPGGTGVYLPKQRRIALKSSEEGEKLLAAATRRKTMATKRGQQYSSHGLAAGTSLQKQANVYIGMQWSFAKENTSSIKEAFALYKEASDYVKRGRDAMEHSDEVIALMNNIHKMAPVIEQSIHKGEKTVQMLMPHKQSKENK